MAYFGLLIAAIAGAILSRPKGKEFQLILLFLIFFPLPYYFTVVGLFRYRFPMEAILMLFAAYTLQYLFKRSDLFGFFPRTDRVGLDTGR